MQKIMAFVIIYIISINNIQAQLIGVKNIPGDYSSLANALTDLNNQGVGTGGVTIHLNQAETAPSGGYIIGSSTLNALATATSPVIINGNNQIIQAQVGTKILSDAILRIAGTDYVTIQNLILNENTSNTSTTTQMERGIWICSFNNNDAAQHCIINNCTVNLNGVVKNNQETGILTSALLYTDTLSYPAISQVYPTLSSGVVNHLKITACTVENAMTGIFIKGWDDSSYYFKNICIGDSSSALGNHIMDFGKEAPSIYFALGIGLFFTHNDSCLNNIISTTLTSGTPNLQGIKLDDSKGNQVISFNDISMSNLSSANTSSMECIRTTNTSGDELNILSILNNHIHDFTSNGATTVIGISIGTPLKTSCDLLNNQVSNININGSFGGVTAITCTIIAGLNSISNTEVKNNIINNIHILSTSSSNCGFYGIGIGGKSNFTVKGNVVDSISFTGSGSGPANARCFSIPLQYNLLPASYCIVDSNRVSNIGVDVPNGQIDGIYVNADYTYNSVKITRNNISHLHKTAYTANPWEINGIRGWGTNGGIIDIHNNIISNLSNSTGTVERAVIGMNLFGNNFYKVYNNTISLGYSSPLTSTGANFGVMGIAFADSVSDIRNNIINIKAVPNGTGKVSALRCYNSGISGVPTTRYALTSNHNIFHVPIASNCYIYSEGLFNGTIVNTYNLSNDPNFNLSNSLYKTFMMGRDTNSYTEDNLTLSSNDIYLPIFNGFTSNGGENLASVLFDYNGIPRNNPPDVGAIEFNSLSPTSFWGNNVENQIKIYPNPSNSNINFYNITLPEKCQYEIIDLMGKVIENGSLRNNQINVDKLQNGIYILKLISNKEIGAFKFHKI